MRPHRRYEKVSRKFITVQTPALTPRELMSLVASDIDVNVKARAGLYGNGSEAYPIPRSMNIHRLANMSERPAPASAPAPSPAPVSAE